MRAAYRRLARQNHPDARGELAAPRMAEINEAWRVLSDQGRRAVYDASRQPVADTGSAAQRGAPTRVSVPDPPVTATPARFPWRLMLGIAVAGIAFVLVNAALTRPAREPVPDNLMEVGSCVDILDNGDAKEVLCADANDGVVADLRPIESICPLGTELHRDRQGLGNVCIRLAASGAGGAGGG